jgi:SAM-dependent methyltransferase
MFVMDHNALNKVREIARSEFAPILTVGVGDGQWIRALLADGYMNTTVVDPSEAAITAAQESFVEYDILVRWLCTDLLHAPLKTNRYALWLDGTLFDRLVLDEQRLEYLEFMQSRLRAEGVAILVTSCDVPSLLNTQADGQLELIDSVISSPKQSNPSNDAAPLRVWVIRQPTVVV